MTDRISKNAALLAKAKEGEKGAEEALVRNNLALVRSIALRFLGRGQDIEDLMQIGCMGLLKAVRGYDPAYGTAFSTYAVPLISGEIKRFLRDDGLIKVSREAKRQYRQLLCQAEAYRAKHGKEPKLQELCTLCGIAYDDAVYAFSACGGVLSLEDKVGDEDGKRVEELCADTTLADFTEKIALGQAVSSLEERDRTIIFMRYYKGLTQNEVAARLGMTQVKVSRAEKRIKEELRKKLSA